MRNALRSIILFATITCASASTAGQGDLDLLVKTHVSTLAKIRSADVTVEHTPLANRQKQVLLGGTHRWQKRGPSELYIERKRIGDSTSGIVSRDEIYIDWSSGVMRKTSITDESRLGQLGPHGFANVGATEAPLGRYLLPIGIYGYFLLRPAVTASDDSRTLAELISEAESVALLPSEDVDGHSCRVIEILHTCTYRTSAPLRVQLFVDEAMGALLRQMIVHHDKQRYVCKITRFADYGDGVYFPQESEAFSLAADGSRTGHNHFRVTDATINEHHDPLVWHFPENSLVSVLKEPPSPIFTTGQVDVHLIGKESAVVRRFQAGTDEYLEFMEGLEEPHSEGSGHESAPEGFEQGRPWGRLFPVGAALILSAVILLQWCKSRRRRHELVRENHK
jgi:hypothetical protein